MNSGNVQRKVHNNLIAAKRFKVRRNFRRSFSQISRFLFLSRAIRHQPRRSRHRSKRQRWLWRLVTWFLSTSGASQESKYFFKFLVYISRKRSKSINTPQEQKTICYLLEWRSFCNICLFSIKNQERNQKCNFSYVVRLDNLELPFSYFHIPVNVIVLLVCLKSTIKQIKRFRILILHRYSLFVCHS